MPFVKVGKEKVFVGAFSYFLDQSFDHTPRSYAEVHPPFPSDSGKGEQNEVSIGSTGAIRSLELWKEPESETVRVVVSSVPEDLPIFLKELEASYPGMKSAIIDQGEPDFVSRSSSFIDQGYRAFWFDVEQPHALPGCRFDPEQSRALTEALVRAVRGRGAWIQACWTDYDWTRFLEAASMVMQAKVEEIERGAETAVPAFGGLGLGGLPIPKIRLEKQTRPHDAAGSTIHIHGKKIAAEYFEKAQHHPTAASIRGMIISKDEPLQLQSALSQVKVSYDYLAPWFYGDARMIRWLRSRALPDPAKLLDAHAKGGFLYPWGQGRELIPTLCLTVEELPVVAHLPQDPQLSEVVRYTRAGGLPPPMQKEKKRGMVLGEGP